MLLACPRARRSRMDLLSDVLRAFYPLVHSRRIPSAIHSRNWVC